jgi:archaellum component FlaC
MKTRSLLLIALLIASPLLTVAVIPVFASTGKIYYPEAVPLNVKAGESVTLNFTKVTWSGAQFYLHWETDGLSQISSSPVTNSRYAGPFDVNNVTQMAVSTYEFDVDVVGGQFFDSNQTYTVGYGWVNGSIPFKTAGGDHWVKAFDGAATSVAVSDKIVVLPAIKVKPSSGPAGYELTITGSAYTANAKVNLTMTYTDYEGGASPKSKKFTANITTGSMGDFTYMWDAAELHISSMGFTDRPINIRGYDYSSGREDTVTFDEMRRQFLRIISFDTSDNVLTDLGTGDHNGLGSGVSVNGQVSADIQIKGGYFNPSGSLTFYWDYDKTSRFTVSATYSSALNGTGFYNATIVVPVTTRGSHVVGVVDASWSWNFTVNVGTTLVLSPTKGSIGTQVTATGYGYTPDEKVTLWYFGYWGTTTEKQHNVTNANVEVGDDGTWSMVFTIKNDFGGNHEVNGSTPSESATANFRILPTLVVVPGSSPADGSVLTAVGTGFMNEQEYALLIDNSLAWPLDDADMRGNGTGYLAFEFFAVGAPGTHVVAIYLDDNESYDPSTEITPEAYALYTITGYTADTNAILQKIAELRIYVGDFVSKYTADISALKVDLAAIKSCCDGNKGDIAALNNNLNSINSNINSIKSDIASIGSDLGSDISGVKSDISALKSDVAGVKSDVASVKSDISSVRSDIDGTKSAVSSVSMELSDVTSDLEDVATGVSSASTFLLVVTALAAITLIVELVILVRKR